MQPVCSLLANQEAIASRHVNFLSRHLKEDVLRRIDIDAAVQRGERM